METDDTELGPDAAGDVRCVALGKTVQDAGSG